MEQIVLVVALIVGLLMVPFGLPGLWVMLGAVTLYSYALPAGGIGTGTIIVVGALAFLGELMEFLLTGRFVNRYGGSRRSGWGAVLGSIVGAIVGVPVPVIGSLIGAFAGAFAGAWLAELTLRGEVRAATHVATGALLGRMAAVATKAGVGCAVIVWVVFALFMGGVSGG
jgi:uncharacterized protein YqgC (DUF456 family)